MWQQLRMHVCLSMDSIAPMSLQGCLPFPSDLYKM
jgi:hypothetical protein